jgi:hypothetical protein
MAKLAQRGSRPWSCPTMIPNHNPGIDQAKAALDRLDLFDAVD